MRRICVSLNRLKFDCDARLPAFFATRLPVAPLAACLSAAMDSPGASLLAAAKSGDLLALRAALAAGADKETKDEVHSFFTALPLGSVLP